MFNIVNNLLLANITSHELDYCVVWMEDIGKSLSPANNILQFVAEERERVWKMLIISEFINQYWD